MRRRSPASRRARASATPAGMTAGRARASRWRGIATWMRPTTSSTRRLLSFTSTRLASRRSQASALTRATPSSVSADMEMSVSSSVAAPAPEAMAAAPAPTRPASRPISWTRARSAAGRSSSLRASVLLATMSTGLLEKSGLMEWKSAACWAMV